MHLPCLRESIFDMVSTPEGVSWMVIVEECEGLCKYDPCLDVIGPEHCLLEAWGSWAVTAGTL